MKNYNIVYCANSNNRYAAIVYSSSYVNPLDEIDVISKELRQHIGDRQEKKAIVFDLLLSNGESFNRFVEGVFDGSSISFDSLKTIDALDDDFLTNVNRFYKNNKNVLSRGVLSARQKFKYARH
ncbi:MAG: type II toxin-antitoxin system RnlB family antitoxin [Anaerovoracaceae bacterium]|jgi:hypothetical protein